MTAYFYTPREQPYGCFSNFSRHGATMDGVWWPTVEYYFQAQIRGGNARPRKFEKQVGSGKAAREPPFLGVPLVLAVCMLPRLGRRQALPRFTASPA